MNIEWTRWATIEWLESLEFIERENLSAAARISEGVLDTVEMLAAHPYAGRVGKIAGTREFAVPKSPFVVGYELDRSNNILRVLAIFDGRRRWPKSFPKE